MSYYFSKHIKAGFDEVVDKVTGKLAEHGFGIITRIDISKTFKEKLDVDFHRYLILGACNPNFAYQALRIENKIGTMLPCNVIIQELDDDQVEVAIVDPHASMSAVESHELSNIAGNVRTRLEAVVEEL